MTFEEVKEPVHPIETMLPKRQTAHSAGYDFYTKEPLVIEPNETVMTFTDVKCKLGQSEVLYIHIRSSVGIKKRLCLANGTGVIDSDYYENPDNDGNIGIALHNYGNVQRCIPQGSRVAQGIIHTFNAREKVNMQRQSGFGSTDLAEEIRDRINNDKW